MRIAVVSGNRNQFFSFMNQLSKDANNIHISSYKDSAKIDNKEYFNISVLHQLRGLNIDSVEFCGTWYERSDIEEIKLQLKTILPREKIFWEK